MSVNKIIDALRNDLSEWKPIPFWSWNDKLDIKQLCEQIDEMKANGLGGYIMHARSGLKTEYLSDEWMNCIAACGNYGQQQGMDSWIYDENGWPSGFVGGKLLEKEENKDCYIEFTIGEYDDKASASYLLDDDSITRVFSKISNGDYLNIFIRRSTSTVDILNEKVVDQFISLTHQAYKQRFGNDFAKIYRGFFSDEPQYHRWGTPYTDKLGEYFQENYNQDILDYIGLLFVEKKGYKNFRYRYWKAMQDLMLNNFSKKIFYWCEQNNVCFTGHYIEETSLGYQMMCCAGIMPFYEYQHIPGIDWLGRWTDNELPIRQIVSVASQLNKKRILTEAMGCCGWDVSPTDLRRIVGFQFVGGINLLCQHLFPYSEKGQRKRDYPAHFSNFNPWVKEYASVFNSFVTRLSFLIFEGEENVNVAVLHPIRSAYFDYKRADEKNGFAVKELDEALKDDIRKLSSNGVAYHFIDETIFKNHGSIKGNKIVCGKKEYDYLILPHILTMDKNTEEALRLYIENGGSVFIMGEKPQYLEAEYYSYDYLYSNCSFNDILNSQPMKIRYTDNELYYTYRLFNNIPFIFIQNASDSKAFLQEFILEKKYKSFKKLNLETLEYIDVPLSLKISPSESVLLFPCEEKNEKPQNYTEIDFLLNNTPVDFDKNTLIVDYVRFSVDGISYSKPYPIMALFKKLLLERFKGKIYFKYEFDIHCIPKEIELVVERNNEDSYFINGTPIDTYSFNDYETHINIKDDVKIGINEFVLYTDWFQDEKVYYTLFGENVTESLKNCLVYDCTIESIYIEGKFGVYTDSPYKEKDDGFVAAKDFYIGETPMVVTEPVMDGFPFFAGAMLLHKTVILDNTNVLLRVKGSKSVAEITINGKFVGSILFGETIDISKYVNQGSNFIDIRIIFSNRNKMGPHHNVDPLSHILASPELFELNEWDDDYSPEYNSDYELLVLGCCD